MAQQVKSPPAIKETQEVQVQSLGQEDPLEEEMTAHSSVLAWKIPWTEESGGLQSPRSWTQLSNSQQQWFHNVTLSERDQILKICCLSIYMNNNKRQNSCVDKKKNQISGCHWKFSYDGYISEVIETSCVLICIHQNWLTDT